MPRPRKTRAELELIGAYRPDRHADRGQAVGVSGSPQPPDWLEDEALALWQELVPQLEQMRLVGEVDSPQLAAMCSWWQAWYRANQRLARGDNTYKASIEASAAWKAFAAIASKYGLTPGDRKQLQVAAPEPADKPPSEFQRFMAGSRYAEHSKAEVG